MKDTVTRVRAPNGRDGARTNMYVAAALRGVDLFTTVKLRNMSAVGALVEAPTLPRIGARVHLLRGSLTVAAEVVWSAGGRCGLRFCASVIVHDWLAAPGNKQQEIIDHTISAVKSGAVPVAAASKHHTASQSIAHWSATQLATDLQAACRLIAASDEALVEDPHVIERHASQLQNLDIAVQTISAVANRLMATGMDDETGVVRLRDLGQVAP